MEKITVSYSTLNEAIESPHTYINKISGVSRMTNKHMDNGKRLHRLIQEATSGKKALPLLKNLPYFAKVEKKEKDPEMEIRFSVNDKYDLHGFLDGLTEDETELLEIKTGTKWSPGMFYRTPQWKIYLIGKPTIRRVWLLNVPADEETWTEDNVRIYNKDVTPQDLEDAWTFIRKGLHVIENLHSFDLYLPSYKCNYRPCQFCNRQ